MQLFLLWRRIGGLTHECRLRLSRSCWFRIWSPCSLCYHSSSPGSCQMCIIGWDHNADTLRATAVKVAQAVWHIILWLISSLWGTACRRGIWLPLARLSFCNQLWRDEALISKPSAREWSSSEAMSSKAWMTYKIQTTVQQMHYRQCWWVCLLSAVFGGPEAKFKIYSMAK